jgi:hypothetical protein
MLRHSKHARAKAFTLILREPQDDTPISIPQTQFTLLSPQGLLKRT